MASKTPGGQLGQLGRLEGPRLRHQVWPADLPMNVDGGAGAGRVAGVAGARGLEGQA